MRYEFLIIFFFILKAWPLKFLLTSGVKGTLSSFFLLRAYPAALPPSSSSSSSLSNFKLIDFVAFFEDVVCVLRTIEGNAHVAFLTCGRGEDGGVFSIGVQRAEAFRIVASINCINEA